MRAKRWFRLISCGFGLVALLGMAPAARADIFEDGQFHQFAGSCNNLTVQNSPSDEPTRVEMITGADVTYNAGAFDTSELTVLDGSIGETLYAYDSSHVTVSGGSIDGNLYAYNTSQVTVSGGSIGNRLYAYATSHVTVSDGTIAQDLFASTSSQVTVSGGSIGVDLNADGNCQVTVSGGSIGGRLRIVGYANVVLDGSDFFIDGELAALGEYGRDIYPTRYGTVSGTFASGETFTDEFEICENGKLILTPEPATLALLAVGGLLLIRRRAAVGYATKR